MKQNKKNKTTNNTATPQVQEIELALIEEPEQAIREKIDPETLKELAESINEIGLIQPVLVRKKKGGKYEIVAGHRRFLACKLNKMKTIKAIIVDTDKTTQELMKLHENIFRDNITAIEEAKWIDYMMRNLKLTQKQIAEKINKSTAYVSERLKLLELNKELQRAIEQNKISVAVALELSKIDDERELKRLLNYAIDSGANSQTVHIWVQDYLLSKVDDEEAREELTQHFQASTVDTKIMFQCFACKKHYELNETIAIRLCKYCFDELNKE